MPRLASQAIGQYYPTPEKTIALLAARIQCTWTEAEEEEEESSKRRKITIFDPCCGQGKAVEQLAGLLGNPQGTMLYGIELNYGRAREAATRMNQVLSADLFGSAITNEAFDILFLNPPYDFDAESQRAELAFLERSHRYLKTGGLLVYIIPQSQLDLTAQPLSQNYEALQAWSMQDPEYETFKQVIVMGLRKRQPAPDYEQENNLRMMATKRPPSLEEWEGNPYRIQAQLPPGIGMKVTQMDQGSAMEEARDRGVLTSREFDALMTRGADREQMPLMPLRKGHLVSLIAAGLLNNMKLEHEGLQILVKGRSFKKKIIDRDNDEETVTKEILEKSIMYIDLQTGEMVKVES